MGTELLIDVAGCAPAHLRSRAVLEGLLGLIVRDLCLHPVASAWHRFPEPGSGVTGLLLLSESHLTVHTFPEYGTASINLFCCRRRPDWPWHEHLASALGATAVRVREIARQPSERNP